jgi:aminoglycoside phosphotransferase (APT) family kinase protein
MESISKTALSPENSQRIIRQHLGSERKIASMEELKDGYFNAAYHIRLEDGFQFVLKIAPPPHVRVLRYEKNIMRTEVETMQLVKARTEIPVPAILFYDESCSLLPSPFYGMEFVDGVPLHKLRKTLDPVDQSGIDRVIGTYLRQMNAITNDEFGYYAQPENQFSHWQDAFVHMLEAVLQDGRDANVTLPMPDKEILGVATRYGNAMDEVSVASLVHWDLWDGNIFINPDTNHIVGVIDFERAVWADPLMEVNFGAFGINQDFLAGYGFNYPFTPAQEIRRSLYNIYLFLIMVIECSYRNYPTHDQEDWARVRLIEELSKLTLTQATKSL